jgi:hypothetical protein
MQDLRPGKGIRSIVLLTPNASGELVAETVFRAKRRKCKKKGSVGIRQVERMVRRAGKGQQAMIDSYLVRHGRSNRKRRDGWLQDMGYNVFKATGKGLRQLI